MFSGCLKTECCLCRDTLRVDVGGPSVAVLATEKRRDGLEILDGNTDLIPMRKFLMFFCIIQAGCSLDASLISENIIPEVLPSVDVQRADADFIVAEVVTVPTMYGVTTLKGSFGEISEHVQQPNGTVIVGVFYQ